MAAEMEKALKPDMTPEQFGGFCLRGGCRPTAVAERRGGVAFANMGTTLLLLWPMRTAW
ncbi:MAG: hypothetical protein ACLSHO_07470 [Dysosmobacter sp.]